MRVDCELNAKGSCLDQIKIGRFGDTNTAELTGDSGSMLTATRFIATLRNDDSITERLPTIDSLKVNGTISGYVLQWILRSCPKQTTINCTRPWLMAYSSHFSRVCLRALNGLGPRRHRCHPLFAPGSDTNRSRITEIDAASVQTLAYSLRTERVLQT